MGMHYGDGTNSTGGSNVRIDALREKAIRAARRDIIFEQLCDKETMPQQIGACKQ
jgi:hypothetical protein